MRAILNKSWRQHPTRHQLFSHLPPITKIIQFRRTRHAKHCWRSRDEHIMMYSYGPPHMAEQRQDDQYEHTFSNYVRIRNEVQKTCPRRWTIRKSGERRSGMSVLPARHDYYYDDDIYIYIYIYIYIRQKKNFKSKYNVSRFFLILYIYIYIALNLFLLYYVLLTIMITLTNTNKNVLKS